MMPTPSTSMSLAKGISTTPVDDGLTLLDERCGMIYHLNHTGAAALAPLLDDGIEAAVTALCDRYAITAEIARRDVTTLRDDLLARRLVVHQ